MESQSLGPRCVFDITETQRPVVHHVLHQSPKKPSKLQSLLCQVLFAQCCCVHIPDASGRSVPYPEMNKQMIKNNCPDLYTMHYYTIQQVMSEQVLRDGMQQ